MGNHSQRKFFKTCLIVYRVFLLCLCAFGVVTIIFLFYFNRVLAYLLSWIISAYTWNFYRISLEIQALQVSPLGGRVFFKGIKYHGENETILVHDGFITWRYWLRRVRQAEAVTAAASHNGISDDGSPHPPADHETAVPRTPRKHHEPCRILAEVRGVEWFVYNRKPAYDSVLATLLKPANNPGELENAIPPEKDSNGDETTVHSAAGSGKNASGSSGRSKIGGTAHADAKPHSKGDSPRVLDDEQQQTGQHETSSGTESHLPVFLNLFPIGVKCTRGAMVMGNEHTRSVLVAKVDSFDGVLDARVAGSLDKYRQCFDFELEAATVQFKPNQDYLEPQLQTGSRLKKATQEAPKLSQRKSWSRTVWQDRKHRLNSILKLNLFRNKSQTSVAENSRPKDDGVSINHNVNDGSQNSWLGLSRYLKDDNDIRLEQQRWKAIEYARFETIVDCPKLTMNFFWDVPGSMLHGTDVNGQGETSHTPRDINGSTPPGYGLEIELHGGTINYGPWADRQRANIQSIFFPASYTTLEPAKPPKPGQTRVYTVFEIVITLKEAVTLRLHTREESKDWRWRSHLEKSESPKVKRKQNVKKGESAAVDPELRPAGWMDLTVGANSCVTYSMGMVPGSSGYNNSLIMDLKPSKMTSSLNHDLMWRCTGGTLTCSLPNPLKWNTLRKWRFDILLNDFEFFIIRDHAFLLTDLVNDWTSGPPSDFFTFVPFIYSLRVTMPNFKVYLNVNDSNIIDSPASLDENAFLVIWGDELSAEVGIPIKTFRPLNNKVTFDVDVSQGGLRFMTPLWSTYRSFLKDSSVGSFGGIDVRGSYNYCTSTSPSLTDTVILDVYGNSPSITLYGFLIRYFLNFKDNYFGEEMHFQTQDEYQKKLSSPGTQDLTAKEEHARNKISNDLDVLLTVFADNSSILLPSNLYSVAEHVKIDIAACSADLRFTNYYMDLQVDFSPLAFTRGCADPVSAFNLSADSSTQLFIDGVSISGHRLFGLPPTEPTYVCNWDFDVGDIVGELSLDFLKNTLGAAQSFAFSFVDSENALPRLNPPILHDITFLRANIRPIKLWLHVDNSAFLFNTDSFTVHFNDWAGQRFSERVYIAIPRIVVACMDGRSASRNRSKADCKDFTYAYISSSVDVRVVETKANFRQERELQQDHVLRHDSRTHRTPWLLHNQDLSTSLRFLDAQKARPPVSPFPPMPEPLILNPGSGFSGSVSKSSSSTKSSPGKTSKSFLSHQEMARSILRSETSTNRHDSNTETESKSLRLKKAGEIWPKRPTGRKGTRDARMAFSSAFETPYFPLQFVEPNTDNVPVCSFSYKPDTRDEDEPVDPLSLEQEDSIHHVSIMIKFESGIRAMFTPDALYHLNTLVASVQPIKPENILDQLQVKTISEIVSRNKVVKTQKSIALRANLPASSIRLGSQANDGPSGSKRRVYDLNVEHLVLTLRKTPAHSVRGQLPASVSDRMTLHLSLDKISGKAVETLTSSDMDQATIGVSLQRLVFWVAQGQGLNGDLQFYDLVFVNSSRDLGQLASLVNNTMALGDSLTRSFQDTIIVQENRLRALVHYLATRKTSLTDPSFLTSTSYALRTSPRHPRNDDSWKLMSRLRHVSRHTAPEDESSLLQRCTSTESVHPLDARQKTQAGFNQWRSWDLQDVSSSLLMTITFGPSRNDPEPIVPVSLFPLKFSVRASYIQIIVDPGSKQNLFGIENLMLSTSSTISKPTAVMVQDWAVELSVVRTRLHLNWGICEILENILQQYVDAPVLTNAMVLPRQSDKKPSKGGVPWTLHIVTAFDQISTSFETINFKAFSECLDMASSICLAQNTDNRISATFLANTTELVSGISGLQHPIVDCRILDPSVTGGVDSRKKHGVLTQLWKAGGICRRMEVHLKEDALGLLGIADIFIRDEMAYVRHFEQDIIGKLQALQTKQPKPQDEPSVKHVFHVALLLQQYDISVKLLSSLTYKIKGKGARSTLRSRDHSADEFAFDFDIDGSQHGFTNFGNNVEQSVFETTFPPINGQLLPTLKDGNLSVAASLAIQTVYIHASEIHALFTTLSRNEVSSFKNDVIRDLELVKSNWKSMSSPSVSQTKESSTSSNRTFSVVYTAKLAAAGLNIKASSSSSSKLSAELVFSIGGFHANVSNEKAQGVVLKYPEIEAALEHVEITLMKSDGPSMQSCGDLSFTASFVGTSRKNDDGFIARSFDVSLNDLEVNVYPSTASSIVDILGYLQQRFKSFNLSEEINTFRARRLRSKSHATPHIGGPGEPSENHDAPLSLFSSMFSIEMNYMQLCWHVDNIDQASPNYETENLVFSISKIGLATRRANSARLVLRDLQLQMVPRASDKRARSLNSALLPEVVFNAAYLSTNKDRRLGFQAVGKSLDLRLTSQFILPAKDLQRSIGLATEELRKVVADWNAAFVREEQENKTLLGNKTLSSVLVDVDFAGAEVRIQSKKNDSRSVSSKLLSTSSRRDLESTGSSNTNDAAMVLRAPGIAFKVEYQNVVDNHSLNAEVKVDASSNVLHPTVVPLILEISESVKEIVGETNKQTEEDSTDMSELSRTKSGRSDVLANTNPAAILGNCGLNIGLRICKQSFGLTCQPIARVEATAQFEDIYITVNTVQAPDQRRFVALSAIITALETSVQHIYSREKTGSFSLDSINLSLMNSRHVSDKEGLSAILKFSPMRININAKQLHDFFLFREIWLPVDLRRPDMPTPPVENSQTFGVQRYQQMAAAGAFPWNASVNIKYLDIRVDLGQSLGKTSFSIAEFWVSSRKSSDFQQNLCLGFEKVGIESAGRLSGFIELYAFHMQTSIQFPAQKIGETPLIEASLGFDDLRAKLAFEYQTFLVIDFSSLEFLMYNVRDSSPHGTDRLVCTVEGDKVHLYCTTQTASQTVGLYHAIQRLIQEKRQAYEQSLKDASRYLRRKSASNEFNSPALTGKSDEDEADSENRTPLKLQTNVMVSLKAVKIGAYPSTFFDNQIFKLEALDAFAKFSVAVRDRKVQSGLGLRLGQVRIALSTVTRKTERQSMEDTSVEEVVNYSAGSRGGTVLKVPQVVANMQSYQKLDSTHIEYTFKSAFEGKVEVGWNYSRISFIRGMFDRHSRALAQRLGKPLSLPAVQITGGPKPVSDEKALESETKGKEQEKITAVVNVPLSKYTYTAIEPPVIVTPQLRDMGEATPPLEWIGLHRDRLPNITHQIVIVPLLEVAKEVEDAYSRILGS